MEPVLSPVNHCGREEGRRGLASLKAQRTGHQHQPCFPRLHFSWRTLGPGGQRKLREGWGPLLGPKDQAAKRCLPVLKVEGWRGLWLPGMFIRVLRFCGRNAHVSNDTAEGRGPPHPGTHPGGDPDVGPLAVEGPPPQPATSGHRHENRSILRNPHNPRTEAHSETPGRSGRKARASARETLAYRDPGPRGLSFPTRSEAEVQGTL